MSAYTFTPLESKDLRINRAGRTLSVQPMLRTAKLALIVGLGASYLRHRFKTEVGMSIEAYRMEVRLQQACELLIDTVLSVKEIRHKDGIPDGANFVRHFRRRFGMTPSGFRRMNKSRFY